MTRGTWFIVGVVLIALVVIPAIALGQDRPARWGWQMYAGVKSTPTLTVRFADGSVQHPKFGDLVAGDRSEVDYREALARYLCDRERHAVSVTLVRTSPAYRSTFLCSAF